MDLAGKCLWVAVHGGMVGSAVVRRLPREDAVLLTANRRDRYLTRQAVARVGVIAANPARLLHFQHDNLTIEVNIMRACADICVEKLAGWIEFRVGLVNAPSTMPTDDLART